MTKVVTRFAPSPTGFLHIGAARTALFAYLLARKHGGTFILRIEDTDKAREVEGATAHIQESLRWLGLSWDFGPDMPGPFGSCIQSERLSVYRTYAERLVAEGHAYPDPYTEEEVGALREKAKVENKPFLFREHRPEQFESWDGTKPLRFKVPEIKRYAWTDAVRGALEAGEEALDDFILIKSDGYPTYNFAHIVDDAEMGVTHIFRADEFIASTPRFLSLYDALGIDWPVFVTLPPILREDKTKKMSKRDGAKDILDYRAEGYLPEAMVNFMAFIGWNPGTEQEIFSPTDLVAAFDISQIQTHGGTFNEEKLRWYNREHLLRLPDEAFVGEALPILQAALLDRNVAFDHTRAERLVPLLRERVHVWDDLRADAIAGEYDFFFAAPIPEPSRIPFKDSDAVSTTRHLEQVCVLVENADASAFASKGNVEHLIAPYAQEEGRGAVLHPVRYALTGREKSPDPFTVASIIGRTESLERLRSAIMLLKGK